MNCPFFVLYAQKKLEKLCRNRVLLKSIYLPIILSNYLHRYTILPWVNKMQAKNEADCIFACDLSSNLRKTMKFHSPIYQVAMIFVNMKLSR